MQDEQKPQPQIPVDDIPQSDEEPMATATVSGLEMPPPAVDYREIRPQMPDLPPEKKKAGLEELRGLKKLVLELGIEMQAVQDPLKKKELAEKIKTLRKSLPE